ncbi:MAG: DUF2244 domain-containing protein [Azospirillaceae bacterium]
MSDAGSDNADAATATAGSRGGTEAGCVFDALLYPHRSLSPRGFFWLMAVIASVSFTVGGYFYLSGAWPVLGFFGLDVAVVWLCFRANYRAGRVFERVRVFPDRVLVERGHDGRTLSRETLETHWARVALSTEPRPGEPARLISRGHEAALGGFLSPEETLDFADALKAALDRARLPDHLRQP